MALNESLEKLCGELGIEMPKPDREKNYNFSIHPEVPMILRELPLGFAIRANVIECPQQKREELFMYVMRANFLGQGTGGSARLGIDPDEKFLTLSLGIPYEMNYQSFKESVEDFVNYVIYWREETAKFEQGK